MNEPWCARTPLRGRSILRGWRARAVATAGLLVGALAGTILYLAFLAARWAWYQNLAIVLSVWLLVPTLVVLTWALWGISVARRVRSRLEDEFSE